MNLAIERLFYGRNPVLRDSLIHAIKSHEPIQVARLATLPELLSPLVLLSTLAREWKEDDLVDDYSMLIDLTKEQLALACPPSEFWHPENFLVSSITALQPEIGSLPEADYIGNAYRELTGTFDQPKKGKRK